LSEFFYAGGSPDFAVHERADGDPVLIRTCWAEQRRVVDRYAVCPSGLKALDRAVFEIDNERFAEVEKYRSASGPNLHLRPIVLPGMLDLDAWNEVLSGSRVRLAHAGAARLVLGEQQVERRVICLVAARGEEERELWLAQGVGEILLSPRGADPQQWLTAWRGGDETIFAEPPLELTSPDLPALPANDDSAPREDVF
jgi:hypothetical protein